MQAAAIRQLPGFVRILEDTINFIREVPRTVSGYLEVAGTLRTARAALAKKVTAQDSLAQTKISEDVCTKAEKLMDLYGNMILRLAYSYLHNMSDAEEILQETLIRFLQTAPSFRNHEHEKAWLLHVAANLSKNKIKYNTIRSTDELNDELIAEEREDLAFVWDAVKELPEKYREVIHLFYYEDLSTKQIAEVLKRKESTIRSDLKRGREKLKEILKEAYDFEE